jgi:hypothetical protein
MRLCIADIRIQPAALGTEAGLVSARPEPVLVDEAWPRASDPQRHRLKVDVVAAQAHGLPFP